MTSQKSSVNKKSKIYDLKAGITQSVPMSVVMFIWLNIFYVFEPLQNFLNYFTQNRVVDFEALRKDYVIMLANSFDPYEFYPASSSVQYILLAIGVIAGVILFSYKTNKKAVNIYFSSPVDRSTMFINRAFGGLIVPAIAVALPVLADVILNIFFIGNPSYILYGGFFLFLETFAYYFIGLAFSILAISICNTVVESLFTSIAFLGLPTAVMFFITSMLNCFLRGFNSNDALFSYYSYGGELSNKGFLETYTYLNPLFFSKNMNEGMDGDTILDFFSRVTPDYATRNDYMTVRTGAEKLSSGYVVPLILWLAIGVAVMFIARKTYMSFKAEKAGNHGSSPFATHFFIITSAIAGTGLFAEFLTLAAEVDTFKVVALAIVIAAVTLFICYYLLLVINRRSFKQKAKAFIMPAALSTIFAVMTCVLYTGGFGYTTYVPEVDDIECALIAGSSYNALFDDSYGYNNDSVFSSYAFGSDSIIGAFDDKNDLKKLTEIMKDVAVKKDKDASAGRIVGYYKLKNGKIIVRNYKTSDIAAYEKVLSLRDTNGFKKEFAYLLGLEKTDKTFADMFNNSSLISRTFNDSNEDIVRLGFAKGNVKVIANSITKESSIKNTTELRKALYDDLTAQTYEDRINPSEKPLGTISFSYEGDVPDTLDDPEYSEYSDYYTYLYCDYIIYPSMKNTVNYLKNIKAYDLLFDDAIDKKVKSVSSMTVEDLIKKESKEFYYNINEVNYLFESIYFEYNPEDDYYEGLDTEYSENVYGSSVKYLFKGSQSTADQKEIKDLIARSVFYGKASPKDTVILIEYENGNYTTRLIKQ